MMSVHDDRRHRQAQSIGFIPAPAGESCKAMRSDDEALLERVLRLRLIGHNTASRTVRAVITPWGIEAVDLRGNP